MKKILIASDLSDSSKRSFDYIMKVCLKVEASLHVLNVNKKDVSTSLVGESPGIKTSSLSNRDTLDARLTSWLEEGNEIFRKNKIEDCIVQSFVESGDPVNIISTYANEKDYDLLVLNAKGGGKIRQLLGSLAYPLLEEVNIPVFFIPDVNDLKLPKQLMFSTDFHQKDMDHLVKLYQLFAQLQLTISLSHFSNDDVLKSDRNILSVFISAVQDRFPYQKMTYQIFSKKDGDSIIDCLESLENGWISMSTHKRGTFEKIINPSISKKLLNNLERPLIVFKN
ncbi:universal stress protein [Flavobacteriales bacterium]|jgi:nucleotide-binding universal stress UspA family protein|nr:universal stress protein [Flavobacteriales bacterium]